LTIEAAPGGRPPTLTAPGAKNEVLLIEGTPNVTVRGLRIASAAEQFGLVLQGYLAGVTIENVDFLKREELREPAWSHVWAGGAARGDPEAPFRFEGCRFSPWKSGLVFQGNGGGLIANAEVLRCRFEVKVRQLELIELVRDIRIEGNLFLGGETAIVLDHLTGTSGRVTIANNSFLAIRRWIDPTQSDAHLPGLRIARNAIFEPGEPDGPDGRLGALARQGWTFADNLCEGSTGPEESESVVGIRPRLEVRSREPSAPDFLRPAPGSPLLRTAGEPRYVGAVAP
jgi:hypothetical protein